MKKLIFAICLSTAITFFAVPCHACETTIKQPETEATKLPENSREAIYQDMVISLPVPYMQKEIDNYYDEQNSKEQVTEWLVIDSLFPYIKKPIKDYYGGFVPVEVTTPSSKVIEANYFPEKAYFIVKLQVEPYLGAHDPIGIDNLTFKIDQTNGNITLEKYEHVKSFKIPEHVKKQHLDLNLQ